MTDYKKNPARATDDEEEEVDAYEVAKANPEEDEPSVEAVLAAAEGGIVDEKKKKPEPVDDQDEDQLRDIEEAAEKLEAEQRAEMFADSEDEV